MAKHLLPTYIFISSTVVATTWMSPALANDGFDELDVTMEVLAPSSSGKSASSSFKIKLPTPSNANTTTNTEQSSNNARQQGLELQRNRFNQPRTDSNVASTDDPIDPEPTSSADNTFSQPNPSIGNQPTATPEPTDSAAGFAAPPQVTIDPISPPQQPTPQNQDLPQNQSANGLALGRQNKQ